MDKALDYLLHEYRERIQALAEAMARGGCSDFDEYRFTCGQIRGLEAACSTINDLKTRLETIDD